jgi:hypothetical protein
MLRRSAFLMCIAIAMFFYIIPGCSKSNDKDDNGKVSLVNKWFYVNRITWDSPVGGSVLKDTSGYPDGSYADFRSDGKVYSYIPDGSGIYEHDTANYQYSNNILILIRKTGQQDTMTVETLTSSNLTTHLKDTYPGGTEDVRTNLKR